MINNSSKKKSLLIVCTAAFLFSCEEKKPVEKKATPKDFAVLTLTPRHATTYNDFPATIQGQDIVEIRPMVDGYLEAIYVEEGATVTKGQLLFKIRNPQYDQAVITANASIKIAEADVNAAKMDVEKVRPLVEKDIVSKFELESAQYSLQSKEAALAQARATLANAQTNVGYTLLRSPQKGIIGSIPYKIGALVSNTTTNALTTLSNIAYVYAYFSLNEKQFLSFSGSVAGNTMQEKLNHLPAVTLILADGTEYANKGKLETASGLISTETGTASFKAIFPNPLGIIRSGASATVRVPRTLDTALMIPQSATYELQDKRFVYSVTADNRVMSAAIVSKPTNDGQFLIVQNGLKKGDRIVLNGSSLKDSTIIIPRPINADSLFNKAGED
jgi:membrane fusion protein (multidrug efflux system)